MSGRTFPFRFKNLTTSSREPYQTTTTPSKSHSVPSALTMYPDTFEGFAIPAANQWQKTQRIEVRCQAPEPLSP